MTKQEETLTPSSHGIVVDHNESKVRYAISDKNFNPDVVSYVRDLRRGETVLGYRPKPLKALGEEDSSQPVVDNETNAANLNIETSDEAEGSSTEGSLGTDK